MNNIIEENKPKLKKRLLTSRQKDISLQSLSFNKELLKNIKKVNVPSQPKLNIVTKENSNKTSFLIPHLRKDQSIGYRNIKLLKSFLTEYKKIKSRRLTKLTLKQQRQLSKSVKRARMLKLFDPRKTLKPKKFLNFDRKLEVINILLTLKLVDLNNLLNSIRLLKISNIKQTLVFIELIKISVRKSYVE